MIKKRIHKIILVLIFVISFGLRTYKIDNPIADWHSWRQADTATISRNFVKEGFTPFYPKFDLLHSLNEYGEQNNQRLFLAEFPIYNIITYPFYALFGVNEVYARLVSIFFSSLTAVFLYLLVKEYASKRVGLLSAFVFSVLPFSIYYGRVIMPDPLHVFFEVVTLYFFTLWAKKEKFILGISGALSLALAVLTKPYALVLGLPAAAILIVHWNKKIFKKWLKIIAVILISIVPYLIWKYHIDQHPEGQFGTQWLFNSTNIRFTPAFFRWIIYERLIKVILGGAGFVFFCLGLIAEKTKQEWTLYLSWLAGLAIFISVIATGNVTHDYYQLPLIPIISILTARGIDYLWNQHQQTGLFTQYFTKLTTVGLLVLMLLFSWFEVRGYFNINNWPIVRAGQKADQILPPDAKVIAPYNSDPAFLYQTNRIGWSFLPYSIDKLKEQGATHYVSVNFDDVTNQLIERCKVMEKTDEYVIINLTKCENEPEKE